MDDRSSLVYVSMSQRETHTCAYMGHLRCRGTAGPTYCICRFTQYVHTYLLPHTTVHLCINGMVCVPETYARCSPVSSTVSTRILRELSRCKIDLLVEVLILDMLLLRNSRRAIVYHSHIGAYPASPNMA